MDIETPSDVTDKIHSSRRMLYGRIIVRFLVWILEMKNVKSKSSILVSQKLVLIIPNMVRFSQTFYNVMILGLAFQIYIHSLFSDKHHRRFV